MTMLGQFLAAGGAAVSGSDGPEKYMTDEVLKKCGIKVVEKFDAKNIPADADLIVIGKNAKLVAESNEEVAAAFASNKKIVSFPHLLP